MTLDSIAAEVLARGLLDGDCERALSKALREIDSNTDRALLARWVLGASCWRATLRFLGAQSANDLIPLYRRFDAGELRNIDWPRDEIERLCVECSLPRWLAELWHRELGFESARSLALAMNSPGPITLRANALWIDRESLAVKLHEEAIETEIANRAPHALHLRGRGNLWGSQAWREGLFEVQDEGSQLIAEACRAKPGERWLDLCAGSGGKTLALAASMRTEGELVAFDIDELKLRNLRARIARARVTCVRVRAPEPNEKFDGVLVDAPCSELGTLRRHPDARWRITPESIAHLPKLQRALLEKARAHLRPRARLVYATCTLRRAENEDVAGRGHTLRPDVEGTDGFFIAAAE